MPQVVGRQLGRRDRLDRRQRVVEPGERELLPLALVDDRPQPQRPLVPPVPEQLGVQRADHEPVGHLARADEGAGDEVGGVLAGQRRRALARRTGVPSTAHGRWSIRVRLW